MQGGHQAGDGRGNREGLLGAKEQTPEVELSSGPPGWRVGSRLGVVGEKVQGVMGPVRSICPAQVGSLCLV